jgi:hypothetical protein
MASILGIGIAKEKPSNLLHINSFSVENKNKNVVLLLMVYFNEGTLLTAVRRTSRHCIHL